MSIGTKIKALRFSIDITEDELASAINIPVDRLKFWEKDLNRPSNAALSKIAEYFNIDIDFFFEDEPRAAAAKPARAGDAAATDDKIDSHSTGAYDKSGARASSAAAVAPAVDQPSRANNIKKTALMHKRSISDQQNSAIRSADKISESATDKQPAQREKLKNFKEQVEAKRKEIGRVQNSEISDKPNNDEVDNKNEILVELKKLNAKFDELLNCIKNKPVLANIQKIEITYSMETANNLLKNGWFLLELFKDEKGFLGYRLGSYEK